MAEEKPGGLNGGGEADKPLAGIRILTLEQFGAAPYGSAFLADLGAEVIKVENPASGGDASRGVGPFYAGDGDSLYFQSWHANKKSVLLDLKSPDGRAGFERLVRSADAVMNNLRGDLPAKLGLDYAALGKLKPAIVCLHISAYGRDNERAARPGYDFLMQAEAGLMSLTGDPEGAPARAGVSIIDYMSGATGTIGLLACLLRAQKSGIGCDVDVCLFDVALHQLGYSATWYLNEGYESTRQPRGAHLSLTPVQSFPTADGWVFVACMTQGFWVELANRLGLPGLAADPRFATQGARLTNRAALTAILDAEFRRHPTAHWLDTLAGVLPIGPVNDIARALDNPFVARTGMVGSVPHPSKGTLRVLANPIRIDGHRLAQRAGSAAGADNETLLGKTAT
ncbi:MAG: CaiB/BaiF CoA transferase family protein [Burkholderiales bacterium]